MEISREHSKTIEGQVVEEVHAFQRKTKTDKSIEIACKFCGRMHETKTKMSCFREKMQKVWKRKPLRSDLQEQSESQRTEEESARCYRTRL